MAVKLSRLIIKRAGGSFIAIRKGAANKTLNKVIVEVPFVKQTRLKELFDIRQGGQAPHFRLQRKGSIDTIGKVRRGGKFMKDDLGIRVRNTDKLLPKFAEYMFEAFHGRGMFKPYARGTLNLKNLTTTDLKNITIPFQGVEKVAARQVRGLSKKGVTAFKKAQKQGFRLSKLGRPISPKQRVDRAKLKGIRFIRKNGRIIPIKAKRKK